MFDYNFASFLHSGNWTDFGGFNGIHSLFID